MPQLQERETDRLEVTKAVNKSVRAKMPVSQRAKQFVPFDAVVGLRAALKEKERIKITPKTVSEDMEEDINCKLKNLKIGDIVEVVYYDNSEQNYLEKKGEVTFIDIIKKEILVENFKIKCEKIIKI